MIAPETFWTLLHDSAHWEFELFVGFVEILLFDGIVGLLLWPTINKHWKHHLDRDAEIVTCTRPLPHICKDNGPCNGWPGVCPEFIPRGEK